MLRRARAHSPLAGNTGRVGSGLPALPGGGIFDSDAWGNGTFTESSRGARTAFNASTAQIPEDTFVGVVTELTKLHGLAYTFLDHFPYLLVIYGHRDDNCTVP